MLRRRPKSHRSCGGVLRPPERSSTTYFGLTVVSCQHGAIRQSPDGLVVYGQKNGLQEIPVARTMRGGRAAELAELHRAITEDRPVQHDGRWGARDARSMFRHPAVGLRRSRSRSLPPGIAVTSDEEKSWVRL